MFFLLMAVLFILSGKGELPPIVWAFSAGSALLGLVLGAYEVRRRGNRTHLVREGDGIVVYRKGRLDQTLPPGEIKQVKAGLLLMLKVGLGLGACGVAFTAVGISELRGKTDPLGGLMILALGLVCLASLLAAAWTRFACVHLRLPLTKGWMVEETVLVRPPQFKALFP